MGQKAPDPKDKVQSIPKFNSSHTIKFKEISEANPPSVHDTNYAEKSSVADPESDPYVFWPVVRIRLQILLK